MDIYVEEAIQEINQKRPGWISWAYYSYFKDVRYASQVQTLLRNITLGTPVHNELDTHRIQMYCVEAPGQIRYRLNDGPWKDPYHTCFQRFEDHGLSPAGSVGSNIILCPAFWQKPPIPTKPQCLKVDRVHSEFLPIRNSAADVPRSTQAWILLRELTLHYLTLTYNVSTNIYKANDCLRLPANSARVNPNNYVYYVSSELLHLTKGNIVVCAD